MSRESIRKSVLIGIVVLAVTNASAQTPQAMRTLLDTYCVKCHNESTHAERIDTVGMYRVELDTLSVENVHAESRRTVPRFSEGRVDRLEVPSNDADLWERVLKTLRARSMPPQGWPRPDKPATDAAIAWIEKSLDNGADKMPVVRDQISDYELGKRLAFFLWGAPMDNELRTLADSGMLKDRATLEKQVQRMLADPKSQALSKFFDGWMPTGRSALAVVAPSRERFPDFDEDLRRAFLRETSLFLESQIREDRSVLDLLTANYTFVNERLASYYGIPGLTGPEFRRVTLVDGRRGGILGQGSFLTLTSRPTRTSPTARGKWIHMNLLGLDVPASPPNAPPFPEDQPGTPSTSVRQRMEVAVTYRDECRSCHLMIDPMGNALENFDGIGQWRDAENGTPVDASGSFPDGSRFNGAAELRLGLLERRDAILNTIAEKLLSYALASPTTVLDDLGPGVDRKWHKLQYYEMPAVRAIVHRGSLYNFSWSSLIIGVVESQPFKTKPAVVN